MNNSFAKGQCKYNWDYRVCDELTCLHGSFDKCNELCTKMVKVADRGAYQLDCTNACHCWCDDPQSTYCRDGPTRSCTGNSATRSSSAKLCVLSQRAGHPRAADADRNRRSMPSMCARPVTATIRFPGDWSRLFAMYSSRSAMSAVYSGGNSRWM